MAQRTVTTLIDDIDGKVADETVAFGVDGVEYAIDLSGKNAKKLRKVFAPFVEKARRVPRARGSRPVGRGTSAAPAKADREQNQAIREWARSQGYKVADRGRIPEDIALRYNALAAK